MTPTEGNTEEAECKVVEVEGICSHRSGRFKLCSVVCRGALENVRKQKRITDLI